MTLTITMLADWCFVHRTGKAFAEYSWDKIYSEIAECVRNKSMCYVIENHKIVGICCGTFLANKKVFYVNDILAEGQGVVKKMLKYFLKNWPEYTIEGLHRTGRERQFSNPKRLMERIK